MPLLTERLVKDRTGTVQNQIFIQKNEKKIHKRMISRHPGNCVFL